MLSLKRVTPLTLFLMLLLSVVGGRAAHAVGVPITQDYLALGQGIEYREERPGEKISIDAMLLKASDLPWKVNQAKTLNLGYSSQGYWLRIGLDNPTPRPQERWLEIGYPLLDHIEIYWVKNGQILKRSVTGDSLPFSQRGFPHYNFLTALHFDPDSRYELYLRVASTSSLQVPLSLWEPEHFDTHDNTALLGYGLVFGALLIIAAYNFFLWFSVRELAYLYYVTYVLCFCLLIAEVNGMAYQYLWPDTPEWNNARLLLLVPALVVLASGFSREFLQLPRYNPTLDKLLRVGMTVVLLEMPLGAFVFSYQAGILLALGFTVLFALFGVTAGILNWRAGNRAARFYVLAWGLLIVFTLWFVFTQLGLLPYTYLSAISLQAGQVLEVALLSFALADRINIAKQDKVETLQRLMEEERRAITEREEHLRTRLRKQQEDLLARQQLRKARAENMAKSQFLAVMSHEIRTPMNGVLGMAELMQDSPLNGSQRQFLGVIENSAKALLSIINDILDYSKIETGKLDIEAIDFDLERLVLECTAVFSVTAEKKGLQLFSSLAPGTPVCVRSDPARLRQILLNLLGNAFKFTEQGRVGLRVLPVEKTALGDWTLRFEVSDTGLGLTPEQQGRLFQAFAQADSSTTRKFGGTGLGLSISRKLAELLGGCIGVESDAGVGSTFWFTIHCQAASSAFCDDQYLPPSLLAGKRLLLADDNAEFTQVAEEQARAWGMQVHVAYHGQQVIDAMRDTSPPPFDALVIDGDLPPQGARSVVQTLHAAGQLHSIPTLVFTSGRHAGADSEFPGVTLSLPKPCSSRPLREALVQLLGGAHANRQDTSDNKPLQALFHGFRVLVAEDNPVNQMVLKGMLQKFGLKFAIANDGEEALALVQSPDNVFPLVLMDCEMPNMDGYEATRQIRQWEHSTHRVPIPIVALTAHAMQEHQEKAFAAGMNAHVSKPIEMAVLRDVLAYYLLGQARSSDASAWRRGG